jgi:hypothetical protein
MKLVNLSIAAAAACMFATSAHALKTEDRILKQNYQVEYTKVPGAVNSFSEMITEGEVYGRVRSNNFWWDWETEKLSAGSTTKDNHMYGLGGSMVYKTGFFNGFGATAGFYGALPIHPDNLTANGGTTNLGKAGKDTYHSRRDGTEGGMGVFAEAYGEYKAGKTNVKIGRQGIDSIMLATNDTKMIPNTFEAAVVENKDLPNTKISAGYIVRQKLRDHQSFHSILASAETGSVDKTAYNDDSGTHKGLTVSRIMGKGADANPEMMLLTAENKSVPNLTLNGEYVGIEGFFSTAIAEANYKIDLPDGWTLTPGVRYLNQMDDGAGAIGGASLNGTVNAGNQVTKGYSDGSNADGSILMERLVLAKGPFALMAGYSKVSDDADIIAPWRGFPTGGYTRSMAQLNWVANTKSWMVKADYDFGKAGVIPGFKAFVDYADMDFDQAKITNNGTDLSDRNILHVDMVQEFKAIPNAEFRFRYATINSDPSSKTGLTVDYESYQEYRFEINYLF